MKEIIKKIDVEHGVMIGIQSLRLFMSVTSNLRQWAGFSVDEKLLRMIRDAINEYLGEGKHD